MVGGRREMLGIGPVNAAHYNLVLPQQDLTAITAHFAQGNLGMRLLGAPCLSCSIPALPVHGLLGCCIW